MLVFSKKGENWNTWRKTFQTKEEDHQQAESKNSVNASVDAGHTSGRQVCSPEPTVFTLTVAHLVRGLPPHIGRLAQGSVMSRNVLNTNTQ